MTNSHMLKSGPMLLIDKDGEDELISGDNNEELLSQIIKAPTHLNQKEKREQKVQAQHQLPRLRNSRLI